MVVFVPGKPFQLSLMLVREARSLPKGGAPERCFTGGLRPYHQTVDNAGKPCQ